MALQSRTLTPEEREPIEKRVRSSDAVTHRRARLALLFFDGKAVAEIASATGVCERRVRNTLQRFGQEGVRSLPRRKPPGARRLDEAARATLVELLPTPPSAF